MDDVIVVGSGPNGLAAAVTLAQAGLTVRVIEGASTSGGGCRTEELTEPGFRHDVCSAVHPLVAASPFFRQPLFDDLRASLRQPPVPFAHPLDGGGAAVAARSLAETVDHLGADGPAWQALLAPLVDRADAVVDAVLAPLRSFPAHPAAVGRFGATGILPASVVAHRFTEEPAKALLAGAAAHAMAPLSSPLTGAFGLLLTMLAHTGGWPVAEGGSDAITRALVAALRQQGGTVETGRWISALGELPPGVPVVLDTSPSGLATLAGVALPARGARALRRFRRGPGVCKVDWALSGPVPWTAPACRLAGTLHLGGRLSEVAVAEAEVAAGRHPERPFCLIVQPGVADPTRAPSGAGTLWGYCHVPAGSDIDMTAAIEAQIERFAPGFSDVVVARRTVTAADEQRANPNYVGGDIGGGAADLRQTVFRPTVRWNPYRTGLEGVYLCSSSTPPGAGVHGMCGLYAARTVLHDRFGGAPPFRR
jgi:phytoene dehydrogenase-like protein